MNSIYPIGSLYFGTQSTCPLQSAGVGTWTRIATNFVTGSTAPVIGNGMALGVMNNAQTTFTFQGSSQDHFNTRTYTNGSLDGGRTIGIGTAAGYPLGVTTDPEKSGIIADLPTYAVNVWRRTA